MADATANTAPAAPGTVEAPRPRPRAGEPLLIVGVGASAGGLEPCVAFFERASPNTGCAFVVIHHLDPTHESALPELLGRATRLPVVAAVEGTRVQADCVYVITPGVSLSIIKDVLHAEPSPQVRGGQRPIDAFFESLAQDRGERAACIVLSGAGTDGSLGLRSIKERGGLTLVQTPQTARVDSMPRAAIATGLVDYVLPVENMAARLAEQVERVTAAHGTAPEHTAPEDPLAEICTIILQRTGHDFRRYKKSTLVRRIQHRMKTLRLMSMAAYVERLRTDGDEPRLMLSDMLIGVTQFFRNPEAFEALDKKVLAPLIASSGPDDPVRVWVPACATGEEAYTLAILLREHLDTAGAPPRSVTVFASDIDAQSLETARQGLYPLTIAEHVSPQRLERYFVRVGEQYQINKKVREMCIFSEHNLIRDPPFARLHLISCRNLLIYLKSDLQQQLLPMFHYTLLPGGHLFLGPSENLVEHPDLFAVVDKKNRIFRRKETQLRTGAGFPLARATRLAGDVLAPSRPLPPTVEAPLTRSIERILLDQYAPACVVVNEHGDIVFVSGRTGRYLELPSGVPSLDLVTLARQALRLDLRPALQEAMKTRRETVVKNVGVELDGSAQRLNLIVRPVQGPDKNLLFMVVFQELEVAAMTARRRRRKADLADPMVGRLELELAATQKHLQAALEEAENANQELRLSNEELLSLNEELQSANEELQTSKEEMQSVNEELETVNTELRNKLEELDNVNGDLQNLFRSTQIATVFLDRDLHIKKFTPAMRALFRLIDSDIDRPLTDIAPRFGDRDLVSDVRGVLDTLVMREREVQAKDGKGWFIMRVLPYRTLDDVVDGVVVTFIDIAELKRVEAHSARLAAIVESSQDAIFSMDLAGNISSWNRGAERMYGYAEAEVLGKPVTLLTPPRAELPFDQQAMRAQSVPQPQETVHVRKDGTLVSVKVSLSPLRNLRGAVDGVSAIASDITARVAVEQELRNIRGDLEHRVQERTADLAQALDRLRVEAEERKQVQEQLLQSRKMAGIGLLAGGIAHDFNNLLTTIIGFSELTEEALPPGDTLRDNMHQVLETSRRAADLTRQLLAFARLQVVEPKAVRLNNVLLGTGRMLRRLIGSDIELVVLADEDTGWVRIDPTQLEQIIVNLAINARDAMPNGGRLVIETRNAELDGDFSQQHPEAVPGRYVVMTIRDTGIGMTAEELARCFEPFFTTKERGKGTGLGLATSYGSVHQAGGFLLVDTKVGKGTAFEIYLPRVPPPASPSAQPTAPVRTVAGTEVVLLVDDVPELVELGKVTLERHGYKVLTASDGEQALVIAERCDGPIDLLLTDMVMPLLGGRELARRLLEKRPSLKVIMTSGYTEDLPQGKDGERLGHAFLAKPYTPSEMLVKVRNVLDAPAPTRDVSEEKTPR